MASPHHLLNTSWTSHRLSPLHYKTESNGSASESSSLLSNKSGLETYAARLRDHLTNSLIDAGGWRAQDDPSAAGGLSAIGALQSCTWETISSLSFSSQDGDGDVPESTEEGTQPAGLLITLTYETTTYKAALLASGSNTSPSQSQTTSHQAAPKRGRGRPSLSSKILSGSIHLPLLLTRFPKPLRESFLSFLGSNFDTYVSPLRICSSSLCGVLEKYVESLISSSTPAGEVNVQADAEEIIREMHLTLSFAPPIAPSLKALSVSIPKETVGSFLRSSSSSSSSTWGSKGNSLLSGLSDYLQKHLAMELGLPLPSSTSSGQSLGDASLLGGYVRLTKIACAGFVVTGEGRLKIVAKGEGEDARNRGALRGGEALLRGVLGRAGVGFEGGDGDGDGEKE